MTKKFIILDGNSQIYRAFYAPGPDLHARDGEPTKATYFFMRMLMRLVREHKPDYLAMAMDAPRAGLWRKAMYPDYKAHRKPKPPELIQQKKRIEALVRVLGVPVLESVADEADDIIATLVDATPATMDVVVVSKDKDMEQLVNDRVSVYDPMGEEFVTPPLVEVKWGVRACQLRSYLALVGDTSDNIPGVAKCGHVGAGKLIKKHGTVPDMIRAGALTGQAAVDAQLSYDLVGLNRNAEFTGSVPLRFTGLHMDAAAPIFKSLGFKRWS